MRYKIKFCPSDILCPLRLSWHPFASVESALDYHCQHSTEYTPQQRCVILSDVSDEEAREEDGTPSQYLSPSMVQHGPNRSTLDASSSSSSSLLIAASSSSRIPHKYNPQSTPQNASTTADDSIMTSSPAPSSSTSSSLHAPYVFNSISKQTSDRQRESLAKSVESDVPIKIGLRKLVKMGELNRGIQRQIEGLIHEYVKLVGEELGKRIQVTFS